MGDHKRPGIDVLLPHVIGQMMTSCVYYNQSYGAITRIGHPPLFTHAPKVSVKGTSNKVTTQSPCPSIPTTSDFSFFFKSYKILASLFIILSISSQNYRTGNSDVCEKAHCTDFKKVQHNRSDVFGR